MTKTRDEHIRAMRDNAHLTTGSLLVEAVVASCVDYATEQGMPVAPDLPDGMIVSSDGEHLNWRGVNYVRQPEPTPNPPIAYEVGYVLLTESDYAGAPAGVVVEGDRGTRYGSDGTKAWAVLGSKHAGFTYWPTAGEMSGAPRTVVLAAPGGES